MEDLTQEKVDSAFREIKSEWDRMVLESGKSEQMFIATGNTGEFLAMYQMAKEGVEAEGLTMPVLVEGLTISLGGEGS